MSILEQLELPAFHPSKSDWILLQYIREHAADVPYTAIARLSELSGVGESTITRFAKKMGFENLQAFKLALAKELTKGTHQYIINSSIERTESALLTGRKLLDANIGTLEKTLQSLPDGIVEQCSAYLRAAKRLRFVGLGNSGFMAKDSAYKFYRIGLEAVGIDNSHEMIIAASLAGPGDVFFAVSHSGNSVEIVETVRLAKENQAHVIVVTANRTAQLRQFADVCILYEAKESLLETGSISAKLAQLFIMDLIYTQLVKEMADQAAENKKKTALAVERLHAWTEA